MQRVGVPRHSSEAVGGAAGGVRLCSSDTAVASGTVHTHWTSELQQPDGPAALRLQLDALTVQHVHSSAQQVQGQLEYSLDH